MNRAIRHPVIGGNWKCNGFPGSAAEFARKLLSLLPEHGYSDVFLAVPFPLLSEAAAAFADSRIQVSAQDLSPFDCGAYTGEVSASQIARFGASFSLVGHSERRRLFGDTDEVIPLKINRLLEAGLRPVLCVGEDIRDREQNTHTDFVLQQLTSALSGFPEEMLSGLVIAYEPIWAIGSGTTASSQEIENMCSSIRLQLGSLAGKTGEIIPILYGGSVTAENADSIFGCPSVDGALVGSASLNAEEFSAIILAAENK